MHESFAIAEEIVKDVSDLMSFPDVSMRAFNMLDDPYFSAIHIGQVIGLDPGLSARLLRVVNSAYYGLQTQIETIPHAIAMIGADDLRSLILTTSTVSVFDKIPNEIVDMKRFWRHSVAVAIVAKVLARICLIDRPQKAFSWGILHDIGQLILLHKKPELAGEVLRLQEEKNGHHLEQELLVIGCTHAQVGAALLQYWSLPESIWGPVLYHHQPDQAGELKLESSILHIANAIANQNSPIRLESKTGSEPALDVQASAWELTNLTPHIVDPILSEAAAEFDDLTRMITN